ncbi:MAG: hypothetical protein K0U98_20635 [Deltaproteobacteria bacterium]|nr:hypothetical protein [Deltaproteobacteria bacterium]
MPTPQIRIALDGTAVEAALLGRLDRLEVRESDSEPTLAAMRFKLSQDPTGRFALLDEELFAPGQAVAIDLVAPGGLPQRLFDGYTSHLRPHFEPIESNCYLEILAMDAALLLDAEERVVTYPDALDSDAVEEIVGRYDIPVEVEPTAARHKQDHQMLVQRGTDWQFLRRLARRNGYACFFEHDEDQDQVVAHFAPPAFDADPQADLTILQGDANLAWIDLQWITAGAVRHRGAAIDPIAKRFVRSSGEGVLPALGEAGLEGRLEEGLADAGVEKASALLRDPLPLDAAIEAQGSAATDRDRLAIEARGEVDPALYRALLRARRPALLKGVGERLSGVYYIRSVRTVVEEGELKQTFLGERNALGQAGNEEFGQSAEEVPA